MAENTEQPQTSASPDANQAAPAATGEIQQAEATTSTSAPADGQDAAAQEVADDFEWNGSDVESLPKPLQARAKGMLRYFHKVTQEAAEARRKAEAYDKLAGDPRIQKFLEAPEEAYAPPATPESLPGELTQDDVLNLQSGDPQAVQSVLYKMGQPLVAQINQLRQELQVSKIERDIDAFASARPDFWDIDPRVMKASMQEVAKQGGSVEDAYNLAKDIEKQYFERANKVYKAKVEEKKKAVTASPSSPMNPTVIEVEDAQEAKRVAAEMAFEGKRVEVVVRKKGKR